MSHSLVTVLFYYYFIFRDYSGRRFAGSLFYRIIIKNCIIVKATCLIIRL